MSEIVERAAKALQERLDEEYPVRPGQAEAFVRIVLQAVRDPTDAMMETGGKIESWDSRIGEYVALDCWQDMIDEALK